MVLNIAYAMLHILATSYTAVHNLNRHNVNKNYCKLNCDYVQVATESLVV